MRKAIFDSSVRGSLASGVAFGRAIATVDDMGLAVASGAPRYGRPVLVGSEPAEAVALTTEQTLLMGTGMSGDAATQHTILFQRNAAGKPLKLYAGSNLATPVSSRNLVRADDANYADLLRGLANEDEGAVYTPYAIVVCHGLWIAACSRYTGSAGAWAAKGFSIFASQDLGATWTHLYTPNDYASDKDGGQYWAASTYYPLVVDTQDRPLDVIIVPTDYRANTGSPGGTLAVIRATRATAAAAWTIQPVYGYRIATSGVHFHCAGVVHAASLDRADILIFAGDSAVNEVVRLMWADVSTDLDPTAATITEQRAFHGGGSPHMTANQAVSCCMGPDGASLLVTGDETGYAIGQVFSPDAADGRPTFRRLWGVPFRANWGVTDLIIRTLRPELHRDYFSASQSAGGGTGTRPSLLLSGRYLYSPDGLHWIARAVPSGLGSNDARELWPMGSLLTWACYAGESGVRQAAWPTTRTIRPLRLGPGGTNLLPASMPAPFKGGSNAATKCAQSGGLWVNPYTGEPFDPQPPAKGEVWRIVGDGSNVTLAQWASLFTTSGACWWWRVYLWQGSYDTSNDLHWVGAAMPSGRNDGQWHPHTIGYATAAGARSPIYNQVSAHATDFCIAFDSAVDQALPPGYAMTPAAANPHESLTVALGTLGAQWTIATALRIPEDGWDGAQGDEYTTVL